MIFSADNTLFLHVGMHKTGTTSIQRFLHTNQDALFSRNLAYLAGPVANHSLLILSLFEEDAWHTHRKHFRSADDRERYFGAGAVQRNFEVFEKSLIAAAQSGLDAVVSGEAIYHLTPDGMLRFKEFLAQYFAKIVVVAFVRSPIDFAQSYAQEALKTRNNLKNILKTSPPSPKYQKRFEGFVNNFGVDSFKMSIFEPQIFPSGSSLRMFLRMIGAVEAEAFLDEIGEDKKNISMSMQAAKVLSLVNKAAREMEFGEYEKRILRPLMTIRGNPFRLSEELAQKVMDETKADLEWLSSTLNIRFDSAEWRDESRPKHEVYSKFTSEEFVEALLALANR